LFCSIKTQATKLLSTEISFFFFCSLSPSSFSIHAKPFASCQLVRRLQKKYPSPWLHDAFWLVLKKCTSICLSLYTILLPKEHYSPFHDLSSLILSLNHRFPSLCKISAWAAALHMDQHSWVVD
jgi:hypothetical protein